LATWLILVAVMGCLVVVVIRYGQGHIANIEGAEQLKTAAVAEEKGDFEAAVSAYERALWFGARDPGLRLKLARLYVRSGRYGDATACLAHVLARRERDLQITDLLSAAAVFETMGAWEQARAAYDHALVREPHCAEAHHGLARIAMANGNYGQMIAEMGSVTQSGEAVSSPQYRENRMAKRAELAERTRELAMGMKTGKAFYRLGMAYLDVGIWSGAFGAFVAADNFDDAPADAHFWLGVEALERNDRDFAEQQFRKAIGKCPAHLRALQRLRRWCSGPSHWRRWWHI